MLSDPVSVTVAGVTHSLPRGSGREPEPFRKGQVSFYNTADGQFTLCIEQGVSGLRAANVARVSLSKVVHDVDANTVFNGTVNPTVTMEFATDPYGVGKASIADLRTALEAFLTSPIMNRILQGES